MAISKDKIVEFGNKILTKDFAWKLSEDRQYVWFRELEYDNNGYEIYLNQKPWRRCNFSKQILFDQMYLTKVGGQLIGTGDLSSLQNYIYQIVALDNVHQGAKDCVENYTRLEFNDGALFFDTDEFRIIPEGIMTYRNSFTRNIQLKGMTTAEFTEIYHKQLENIEPASDLKIFADKEPNKFIMAMADDNIARYSDIFKMLGDLFLPARYKTKSAFYLFGQKATGKSTMGKLAMHLLGGTDTSLEYRPYSTLSINQCTDERSNLGLIGRVANIYTEESGTIENIASFKALITRDTLVSRLYHTQRHIEINNKATMIFAGNTDLKNGDDATYERIIPIDFVRSFTRDVRNDEFEEEFFSSQNIANVLCKALAFANILRHKGWVKSDTMLRARELFQAQSNPLTAMYHQFKKYYCAFTTWDILEKEARAWLKDNGYSIPDKLKEELRRAGFGFSESKRYTRAGKRNYAFFINKADRNLGIFDGAYTTDSTSQIMLNVRDELEEEWTRKETHGRELNDDDLKTLKENLVFPLTSCPTVLEKAITKRENGLCYINRQSSTYKDIILHRKITEEEEKFGIVTKVKIVSHNIDVKPLHAIDGGGGKYYLDREAVGF